MISGVVDYIPFRKALVLECAKDDSEELKKKIIDLDKNIQDRFNYLEVIMQHSCLTIAWLVGGGGVTARQGMVIR